MTRGTETKFDINDVDRKFVDERRGMKLVKPIRQNPRRKTFRIGVSEELFAFAGTGVKATDRSSIVSGKVGREVDRGSGIRSSLLVTAVGATVVAGLLGYLIGNRRS